MLTNACRQNPKKKKDAQELIQEIRGQGLSQKMVAKQIGQSNQGTISLPDIQTPKVNNEKKNDRESIQKQSLDLGRRNDVPNHLMNAGNSGSQFKTNSFLQGAGQQNQFLPNIANQPSPRKDPGYDYVSLGQRIQEQIKQGSGRQNKNTQSQPPKSRGGVNSRGRGIMTPTNEEGSLALVHVPNLGSNPQTTTFGKIQRIINIENYLKKVIKSVERRKKKTYQLPGQSNQTQRLSNLAELEYSTTQPLRQSNNGPQALNYTTTTFKNFSNAIVANNQQLQSQNAMMELMKQPKQQRSGTFKYSEVAIIEESRDDSYQVQKDSSYVERKSESNKSIKGAHPYQVAQDKIFIPLEKSTDVSSGYMYKEMKNAPVNHAGVVVFSKSGFVTVGREKNATSDFVSNEDFITTGVNNYILKEIPFFKKFQIMKLFKQWKYIMKWNLYCRKREQLAQSFFFAKPIFSEKHSALVTSINTIRTLPLMEIKQNLIYGKKQQSILDDKCKIKLDQSKQKLDKVLKDIKEILLRLKTEIQEDDTNFENGVKEMRVQALIKMKKHGEELVMFSKARKQKEMEEEQFKIQKIRHVMFDKFIEMILKFVCGNLVEVLFENKRIFKEIFRDLRNGPQFEVSICFNQQGVLDTDPSMEDHHCSFVSIFEEMEKAIYQNHCLIEFINDIVGYLFKEKQVYYKTLFNQIQQILGENKIHRNNHDQIFDNLKKDIQRCREYLEQFITLQEIYDFAKDWEANKKEKQISSEMGFYKETWLLMDRYNLMIEKIPGGNLKLGTILVETQSLKKYLSELPKRVIDSIRHNVTLTMETETKSLREELSKTSEILDQLPTSLNVYVEQVNTLKYVKEKQDDFQQKFQTINKLHQLCKQDNIKVSLTLQMSIDEVSHLYESLPKLQKTAAEGLNQNKDTMEKIMQSSSLVLSKKIKAFEKKYVETYLQDKSRLDDCADTLEELFKRSKAIHEIRSKVILYKEFLKLLYEDDPRAQEKLKQNKLQCSDDYEFVQQLHKETIKLWKMLLYWKKRRQMCYNTPFLQLDTNKIIRSINKINKYFEEKLSKNEFIRDKSRPLCKVVILQVKETSLIIEFLKDLRRESLQQRHWMQIFNLIKAPHLKNSSNFTIVNLREYHIQNYREEITAIIDHANTELKYEKIFKSIKDEWEQLELKIIPYKETMDSYILVNTETLSNAIEENLTTLETIGQSKFASHVKSDIDDWVKSLKIMLKNLEIWVNAQKYWINLDPIFQSTSVQDILGQDTQQFQEYRNQFKRIMWSAFKNPKATYNLMITNRIEVFENLIKYFSVLQKKVHDYLEQRRLSFPRFFFLSDSQFLEFLTLANSNQDFNDYINMMFQGAQKLYINRILGEKRHTHKLEDMMNESFKHSDGFQYLDVPSLKETSSPVKLKEGNINPYLRNVANFANGEEKSIETDTLSQNESQEEILTHTETMNFQGNRKSSMVASDEGGIRLGIMKPSPDNSFQVLGMISQNKELFLFEKPVSMKSGVEEWLVQVEQSMQETVAKMINYAVSSFPKQSLDEWILDYPQQVIITTIHLILSHEINELLEDMNSTDKQEDSIDEESTDKEQDDEDNEDEDQEEASDVVSNATPANESKKQAKSRRSNLSSAGHGTFSKKSNNEDDEDQAMKEYLKKKNELKAQQQAEEEEERRRQLEEIRQKMEANEVPRDAEKEKRKFVDEMFGKDFPVNSKMLIDNNLPERQEDFKTDGKPFLPKRIEFKDVVMTLLQRKSFQGLYLRLQFWINQIVKSLYQKNKVFTPEQKIEIELNSVQRMVMKTIITFLLYQREVVESLMKNNVTDVNDFEWQSQIRLLWTGVEPGCRVDCGGWQTYQQNEYLGTISRLTITPLTNRYFIFMSAALREKSAVLFKCSPSQQYAGEIFEEFANICTVPSKKFQCSNKVQMNMMMQYLNGAALASVWIFFEHLDKLPFIQLQSFNKEIQMVQQQFIIAELANPDPIATSNNKMSNVQTSTNKMSQDKKDLSQLVNEQLYGKQNHTNQKIVSQLSIRDTNPPTSNNLSKSAIKSKDEKTQSTLFTKAGKVCFGVFSSMSHNFLINQGEVASSVLQHIQSAFRIVALTRPNENQLFKYVLKSDGFDNYELLSNCASTFVEKFYQEKDKLIQDLNLNGLIQVHEQIDLRDIKVIAKIAYLLMEQDLREYNQKIQQMTISNRKREFMSKQKTRDEKLSELDEQERQTLRNEQERFKIEINCFKETLRLVCVQKFLNTWRIIYNETPGSGKEGPLDQYELENRLEAVIQNCIIAAFREIMSQSDSIDKGSLTSEQANLIKAVNTRRKSVSHHDVVRKFTSNSGLNSLIYHQNRQEQDKEFIQIMTNCLKDIIYKLNYEKVNSQLRSCIQFLEYMRRMRGIAFIGPTCSGKTSILKLVSNALNMAFGIKMRTSVVNSATFTDDEMYGTIEAFNQNASSKGSDASSNFNKGGIFQIIIDVFEKERQTLNHRERNLLIQSIFLDSFGIDSILSESLIDFLQKSNKREYQNSLQTEFLMDLSLHKFKINDGLVESIPVTMPNGNEIIFPADLYLFFEAVSLKDASPNFISKIGLIMTEDDDLDWLNISHRQKKILYMKHKSFFSEQGLSGDIHINEFIKEFLEPFIDQLLKQPKIQQWPHFNVKSSIISFYNLLNSLLFKLADVCKNKSNEDESNLYLIKECERDVFWSSALLSTIWSFGGPLSKELRKLFDEQFFNYRRKFNINIGGPSRQRFTLFDIYFDPDNLTWDLLQEKLEYKLKLQFNPLTNQLLIPSTEVSQAYFMMDMILGGLKRDDSLDKHFRILGPSATSKSTALHTFIKKFSDDYTGLIVPMSSYLTLDKLKYELEKNYVAKRKNQLELIDPQKKVVLVIDDLHLQTNLRVNVLEFIRTWCVSKGYYDIPKGYFKNIGEFGTIMAENSEYRLSYCKFEGRQPLKSRFLFYTSTLYVDEYDFDKYKIFVQHWLTSKMWNTSKLINKYYILITNTIMALLDKLKRQEYFHNSSFLKLVNFHLFARLCSNMVNYTLISDDPKEIIIKGLKEEDSAANMMLYEMVRSLGDRILLPGNRTSFILRVLDSCKQEFITGNHLNQQYVDAMVLGNYHDRRAGAHIKYLYQNNDLKQLRDDIRQKIRKCSNNHFLESFLDAPNGPKEIFRLSRIFFKEMQHLILIGQAGCGKHEYLQLAAIVNEGLIFELNVSQFCDPLRFAQAFKQAIISAVSLNSFTYIVINDQELKDPMYIDFTYNFIINMINNESVILIDEDFKKSLIDIEKEIQNQTSHRKVTQANNDILYLQALRKIQKNIHIVFMISDFQSYFEWISLFPGLESKCEVIHMEELSYEGYKQLTSEFFIQRDTDNTVLNNQNLVKSLVEARQIAKNKILQVFYSQNMLMYTSNEDYMTTQAGEYIFNSDQKLHGFIYNTGNFIVSDLMHKQLNYNLPVELNTLYKTKFVMYLELFRFLYDFLSMNLVIRRNYYETFLRKASEFADFFKDIKTAKSTLHNESNQITYKLVSLKDKIAKIQQIVTDKENNILRRQKDINDLDIELKNNKDELNSVIYEKDQMIDEILDHLEKINGSEFSYVISCQQFKPQEEALLNIFAIVIEQDSRIQGYIKSEYDMYFLNREELINILNDRRNYDYDAECFNKIKDFINQYTINDFKDKPLFKQIFNYLMELYRKLNVRNTMANTFSRIKEIKEQIDSNHFSINYSKQFIDDKKEEMEGLKAKYERIQDQEASLSKRIEEAEISHMRTEHIFLQVEKYTNKIYGKLTEIKRRIDTLLGDCIIMAASVSFLGFFSFKERMQLRKDMYDYINNGCAIKCSPCWSEVSHAAKSHTQLFKQVIKEYGLRKQISYHNISGIVSQPVLVEALFTMIFAPSCPLIIDPTGHLQEFMLNKLLSGLKAKKLFASDQGINSKIEQVLRSTQFSLLNDLNDCSLDTFGLSQNEPLLTRLSTTTHNGFDFDYDRLTKLKQLHTLNAFHNSYNSVNKRIPTNTPEYENLSFYQVQIFSPRFQFTLNKEYMSKATMFVTIDDTESPSIESIISAPWVEIKEMMLKHFLPDEYKKIAEVKEKLKYLDLRQAELNKGFENAFLVANQDTLQNINDYTQLKQSVEDIRYSQDERKQYQKTLQDMLNEHNLLSSYANVISIIYLSLKRLQKISGEITYSWKMYLGIIEAILQKVVRDLHSTTSNTKAQKDEQQSVNSASFSINANTGAAQKSQKSNMALKNNAAPSTKSIQKEFTIDEEFFSTSVIPSIYGTLISGIKQHLIPLFNLILSVKISQKKKEIKDEEVEFFFKQLFQLKDFHKWRNTDHDFIDLDQKLEKARYYSFKREILKVYPDSGKKVMENIEKEIGQQFTYKTASLQLYGKIFQQHPEFKQLPLMTKINIGFLCPDHEFKSKICQLVYEQLSSIFSFNEEPVKLHHFIKTASWSYPISLFCQNQINLINTVCSIASYYGVGLEVLRTDPPQHDYQSEKKNQNLELSKQIKNNLIDYSKKDDDNVNTYLNSLGKDAAIYEGGNQITNICQQSACLAKINIDYIALKENLVADDKSGVQGSSGKDQNPLQLIEQCALSGSWVFISTIKFPSFWHKMCQMLEILKKQNKIMNTFRIFIDLQGYQQNEIPDSFIFDYSISFYLTEFNNEDMEGFNDIWANILNDKILVELTTKDKTKKVEPSVKVLDDGADQDEARSKNDEDFVEQERRISEISQNQLKSKEEVKNELSQEQFIKNEKQRELYKDFLRSQIEESKNNSNTLIFGSDLNEEIIDSKKQVSIQQEQVAKKNSNDFDNLNDMLEEIRSMGMPSSKESKAKFSQKTMTQDGGNELEFIEEVQENKEQEPKVSRINSLNNSIDISKGENLLIQELQDQLHSQNSRQQSKRMMSESQNKEQMKIQEESFNEVDPEELRKQIQSRDQQIKNISDIEANEAFNEFNVSGIEQNEGNQENRNNDTSELL